MNKLLIKGNKVVTLKNDMGFSLIEVMVVVAIIGILTAIAVPSYSIYITTSNRTEAQRSLVDLVNRQEQFYMDYRQYAADTDELGVGATYTTESGYYSIVTKSIAPGADFTLTATAIGRQASDSHCATFTLDNTGAKGATSADCWK